MLAQILLSLALLAPPAVLEGPGVCQAALKRVALNKAKPETMLERTFLLCGSHWDDEDLAVARQAAGAGNVYRTADDESIVYLRLAASA